MYPVVRKLECPVFLARDLFHRQCDLAEVDERARKFVVQFSGRRGRKGALRRRQDWHHSLTSRPICRGKVLGESHFALLVENLGRRGGLQRRTITITSDLFRQKFEHLISPSSPHE